MNAKILFATLAIAAAASGVARADEVGDSQYAIKFEGSRSRAEVMAEAASVPIGRNPEVAGSRALPQIQSTVDVQTVRALAVEALRQGKIPSGEYSL